MVKKLKAEIGDFNGGNVARDGELKVLLQTKQELLADSTRWSFLERRWEVVCPAGVRYVDVPTQTVAETGLVSEEAFPNWDHEVKAFVKYSSKWFDLDFGVDESAELNYQDSDVPTSSDPIRRVRLIGNVATDAITAEGLDVKDVLEIWPVPTVQQTLRLVGQRRVRKLEGDSDSCDLDSLLLVFLVAADELAVSQPAAAQIKLKLATERYQTLRSNVPKRTQRFVLGGQCNEERHENMRTITIGRAQP